jgi:hypothetical protein
MDSLDPPKGWLTRARPRRRPTGCAGSAASCSRAQGIAPLVAQMVGQLSGQTALEDGSDQLGQEPALAGHLDPALLCAVVLPTGAPPQARTTSSYTDHLTGPGAPVTAPQSKTRRCARCSTTRSGTAGRSNTCWRCSPRAHPPAPPRTGGRHTAGGSDLRRGPGAVPSGTRAPHRPSRLAARPATQQSRRRLDEGIRARRLGRVLRVAAHPGLQLRDPLHQSLDHPIPLGQQYQQLLDRRIDRHRETGGTSTPCGPVCGKTQPTPLTLPPDAPVSSRRAEDLNSHVQIYFSIVQRRLRRGALLHSSGWTPP